MDSTQAIAEPGLIAKGRCGVSGRWAHVPWVGLFDPAITDGAQHGFYIVYLFSADMKRVYLSINQGTTEVKDELGAGEETFNELRSRAAIMRERAPDFQKRLKLSKIDLILTSFFREVMRRSCFRLSLSTLVSSGRGRARRRRKRGGSAL